MTIQYQYGDSKPVLLPIAQAQAVAVGDLVGQSAGTLVRASDTTWVAAPSTPSAPTVAASAATRGTALTNAATGVKVAAQYPWGEGELSTAGSATPTAAFGLKVTLAALPTYTTAWNVYVEDSAGSGTYKLQQVTTVSAGIIYVDSYGTGAVPSGAAPTATQMTQYAFAQLFQGVSAQAKGTPTVPLGFFGDQSKPYGNSSAVCRVDTTGTFNADCASATFAVGDKVGPAKDTGNTLMDQKVVAASHASLAVAEVVEAGTSITKVKIRLLSVPAV